MIPEAQKQQMAEAVAKIRETMAAAAKAADSLLIRPFGPPSPSGEGFFIISPCIPAASSHTAF